MTKRNLLLSSALIATMAINETSVGQSVTETITYDAMGRIKTVQSDERRDRTYVFDKANNLESVTYEAVAPNSPPQASDDSLSLNTDSSKNINPINNDSDPDGDTLSLVSFTNNNPNRFSVSRSGNVLTVMSGSNANTGSIDYVVSDGTDQDTGRINVTISEANTNTPPTVVDDSVSLPANSSVSMTPLDNDSDSDGDVLTITSITVNSSLIAASLSNNEVDITAAGNSGSADISYEVSDGTDTSTGTINVSVTPVDPGNSPPVAVDDETSGDTNSVWTFDPRSNDSDPDGDLLQITNVTVPNNFLIVDNVTILPGGTGIEVDAGSNAGSVVVDYEVSDGEATDTAQTTIWVNDDPTGDPCDNPFPPPEEECDGGI